MDRIIEATTAIMVTPFAATAFAIQSYKSLTASVLAVIAIYEAPLIAVLAASYVYVASVKTFAASPHFVPNSALSIIPAPGDFYTAIVGIKQVPFSSLLAPVPAVQAAPTTFNQSAFNETGLVNLVRS